MSQDNRIYFAQRAAEEQERAEESADGEAARAHARLQRAYLERASVGDRPGDPSEIVG